jgi:hypothetical protein
LRSTEASNIGFEIPGNLYGRLAMPLLPNANRAVIEPNKITSYLLSHLHPYGSAKAAFFESFGFSSSRPHELADSLLTHARTHPATSPEQTKFGEVFEVNGPIISPDGLNPIVRVIWIVRTGEDFPRLVTAVPSKASDS